MGIFDHWPTKVQLQEEWSDAARAAALLARQRNAGKGGGGEDSLRGLASRSAAPPRKRAASPAKLDKVLTIKDSNIDEWAAMRKRHFVKAENVDFPELDDADLDALIASGDTPYGTAKRARLERAFRDRGKPAAQNSKKPASDKPAG